LSRRAGGSPERGEVSPLVRFVERVRLVGGVGSVKLGSASPRHQRRQRLVDQNGVRDARMRASRTRKQPCVDVADPQMGSTAATGQRLV
jgi:hypothetical protein